MELRVSDFPKMPVCADNFGRLNCDCRGADRSACVSARYFWIHARTIANAPDDKARWVLVKQAAARSGKAEADRIRAAAKHLMTQPQGDLLRAA